MLGDPLAADSAHIGGLIAALPDADHRDDRRHDTETDDDPDRAHEWTPLTTNMTSVSIVPAAAELVTRLTEAADVPHLPARVAAPVRVRVNFLAGCRHLR